MTKVKIYSAYNPPPKVVVGIDPPWPESVTRQSEMAACDINNVVARYKTGGVLPADRKAGVYANVSEMGDYRTAIEHVRAADTLFMELPSGVRSKFDNDPAAFVDFVSDPANHDELVELGIVEAPQAQLEAPSAVDPAPPSEADV